MFRVPAGFSFGFGFIRVPKNQKYSSSGFSGFEKCLKIGFVSGSGLENCSKPVGFSGSGKPDHALIFMIEVVLEIWKRRLENQNTFILIKVGDVVKKIPEPGRHSTRLGFKMAMQVIFPIICIVFLVMYAFMIINSLN